MDQYTSHTSDIDSDTKQIEQIIYNVTKVAYICSYLITANYKLDKKLNSGEETKTLLNIRKKAFNIATRCYNLLDNRELQQKKNDDENIIDESLFGTAEDNEFNIQLSSDIFGDIGGNVSSDSSDNYEIFEQCLLVADSNNNVININGQTYIDNVKLNKQPSCYEEYENLIKKRKLTL